MASWTLSILWLWPWLCLVALIPYLLSNALSCNVAVPTLWPSAHFERNCIATLSYIWTIVRVGTALVQSILLELPMLSKSSRTFTCGCARDCAHPAAVPRKWLCPMDRVFIHKRFDIEFHCLRFRVASHVLHDVRMQFAISPRCFYYFIWCLFEMGSHFHM